MISEKKYLSVNAAPADWSNSRCDRYDYLLAAFCGGMAGLIDVFFVGDPLTSQIGKATDKAADELVKKATGFFWNADPRSTGKSRQKPQTLEQCISYLEQAFPVNYDARYAKDLAVEPGVLSGMRPMNHHLLSLAHSPDPIGLLFSIINQWMGYATFVDKGKIIHAIPGKVSGAIPYLQGNTMRSMIFCGFVNWIGHLLSDISGSSSTRRAGKTGRGAGIPIPFYELFLGCEFGDIDGKTLADNMIQVFEEGYDLRFGAAMAVPVVLEELMIRILWMIRQRFVRKKSWKESYPSSAHEDLRIMLIVGNATLCVIDGADAAAHGLAGGNFVSFVCHLNLVGWARLVMLVLKELAIRMGPVIDRMNDRFWEEMAEHLTPAERRRIAEFHRRMQDYDRQLAQMLADYVRQIEEEYWELYQEMDATFRKDSSAGERAAHSVRLAEAAGVKEEKIVRNLNNLDDMFL